MLQHQCTINEDKWTINDKKQSINEKKTDQKWRINDLFMRYPFILIYPVKGIPS
jgi:hypothetical protein